MSFPFTDKTSSYLSVAGLYDDGLTLMTAITAVNGAVSAASGMTLAASTINKMIYGSASRMLQFTSISVYDTLALTGVTALGLATVSTVWAIPTSGGTSIFLNVCATQATAITFRVYLAAGSAVTAGSAQPITLYGLGA